ncbi:terminase gpP N-terminus-related DNA-binding protein [Pseudoprevotella muciniphila]|nr:terminase [Pseudoprevotella muciniphila]
MTKQEKTTKREANGTGSELPERTRLSREQKTTKREANGTGSELPERTRLSREQKTRKKTLGRSLYMSGMELTEIADQLGVSRQSVSKWCSNDGWKEARAAKNISRPELVNKLLLAIDNLIAQVNASGDPEAIGALADKLSKLSSTIEKLDKKANVIDAIEVFMAFNRWIQDQACYDPEITPELIKAINKYQNKFLMEKMASPSAL